MKDKRLLEIALANTPKLIYKETSPVGMVEISKSSEKINVSKPMNYENKELSKGDIIILDFGQHLVGHVSFDLKSIGNHADAPALIRLHFAEQPVELFENAEDYNGWVSASWIEEDQIHVDVIPSKVELPRRYSFRYMKLEVIDISDRFRLGIDNIICISQSSADDSKLEPLRTSNILHQNLDKVAVKTLHECMQEVFEDGPKRDRRLWIGDFRMQALANYETYHNNELVKECLYLFGALTSNEGRVGACIFMEPEPEADNTFMFDYSLFFINTLYDYYAATKDIQTVKDLWHVCVRQVELSMDVLDENYLVLDSDRLGWCFVDWNLELNKQASAQGIFMYALEAAIELAKVVEDVLEEEKMAELYLKLKDAANKYLFSDVKKLYISGDNNQISVASQVWMVLGKAVEGNAAVRLIERIKKENNVTGMVTPYMYHNYIMALIMIGKKDEALKEMETYWGGMLDAGASTFWELYNPENPNESPYGGTIVNSYCHAWSCGPTYFLRKYFCN